MPDPTPPDGKLLFRSRARLARLIDAVLRENGMDDNGLHPHSWRCEHPDRYPGYCTCVNDLVTDLVNAVYENSPDDPRG